MRSEEEKFEKEERVIFLDFVEKMKLQIDIDSIRRGISANGEPDILCTHYQDGPIAVEIVSFKNPDIAQSLTKIRKGLMVEPEFMWTADNFKDTLQKKLNKKTYSVSCPIELLCYTDANVLPDNVILPTIRPMIEANCGPFRKVWLSGTEGNYLVWEKHP
jgi:hypothetical protein